MGNFYTLFDLNRYHNKMAPLRFAITSLSYFYFILFIENHLKTLLLTAQENTVRDNWLTEANLIKYL